MKFIAEFDEAVDFVYFNLGRKGTMDMTRCMKLISQGRVPICATVLALAFATVGWAATNNTSNAPTFIWMHISTNALADPPGFGPTTVDVGVDLDADGAVDRWLSQERTEWLRRDGSATVTWNSWRTFFIRLDADAGRTAKIRVVDNSANYYIAVKAFRLNHADGVVVPNGIKNGFFEDITPLNNWTVLSGSVTNKAQLIKLDTSGAQVFYGSQYFTSAPNGLADTVTIESDSFVLTPPTSFVYGMAAGGVSEKWNSTDYGGKAIDRGMSYLYLDVGTATTDPNGQYDAGIDIPLTGFSAIARDGSGLNNMHTFMLNTTGLEGRRAQVVAVDDSESFYIGLDGFRMNWDPNYITNGGFEDVPEEMKVASNVTVEYTELPDGEIPGWNVSLHNLPDGSSADASIYYFPPLNTNWSNQVYIGTHFLSDEAFLRGVEIRSDVFVIAPIPNPAQSIFMQYAGFQGTNREFGPDSYATIQLQVDVNGNGAFDDEADYVYREVSQGMGWNLNTSNLDLWQYPENRFYILPEHQGKQARIFVADNLTSGYGWMAVDDFFIWNGHAVVMPFPNADFEMGRPAGTAAGEIPNWIPEITGGALTDWLAATDEITKSSNPPTTNRIANGRFTYVDGNFAADTNGADGSTGTLTSIPFQLPQLTAVADWSIY